MLATAAEDMEGASERYIGDNDIRRIRPSVVAAVHRADAT
jgi:hypothetical protein